MRWFKNKKRYHYLGETRTVGNFLLFPRTVKYKNEDGDIVTESRWFEYAEINQEYKEVEYWDHWDGGFVTRIAREWVDTSWAN